MSLENRLYTTTVNPLLFRTEIETGGAIPYEARGIRYMMEMVPFWLDKPIRAALYTPRKSLSDELKPFCPIDDKNLIELFRDCYVDEQDGKIADLGKFEANLQTIINHMAVSVPQICFEGIHGTGKTTLIQELARKLGGKGITVASTKYTGFIEDDETDLYTGLDSDSRAKDAIWVSSYERRLESRGYELSKQLPSTGELSWNALKQYYLMLAAQLYRVNGEKVAVFGDRSVISRMQSFMKDMHSQVRWPFVADIDTRVLRTILQDDNHEYKHNLNSMRVILPVPYTFMLDEPFDEVQARLESQGETSRRDKNRGNHERMTAFAQAYEGVLSKYEGGSKLFRRTNATSMEDKIQAGYEYVMEILDGR